MFYVLVLLKFFAYLFVCVSFSDVLLLGLHVHFNTYTANETCWHSNILLKHSHIRRSQYYVIVPWRIKSHLYFRAWGYLNLIKCTIFSEQWNFLVYFFKFCLDFFLLERGDQSWRLFHPVLRPFKKTDVNINLFDLNLPQYSYVGCASRNMCLVSDVLRH
jgi:hypothetical protein